jgi:hypothetical protein
MPRVKTGNGKGRKSYSREAKIASLVILRDNEYNYRVTAKTLKISEETLHKWNDELGPEIAKNDNLPVRIELAKIDIQVQKNAIIEKSATVLTKIIDKIESGIAKENRIMVLVNAAVAINGIMNTPTAIGVQNNQFNFIQDIHDKLKGKIDESSKG